MSTTLVTLAADYVSGLLVQGTAPDTAFEHARLRFGIGKDLIQAEINARHAFALAVEDHGDAFDAAAESLRGMPFTDSDAYGARGL